MDDDSVFEEYDPFAETHVEAMRESPFGAGYERPALRALAGSVRNLDVLTVYAPPDALAWLGDEGARVVAVDPRERDLREPLPVPKESIDLVLSSMTLHYLPEWEPALRDFRRVTRPGGALVFSTHHPCMGLHEHDRLGVDYFSTGLVIERWGERETDEVRLRYWRRPLQAIASAVIETGWRIEKIVEPRLGDAIDPCLLLIRAVR